MSNVNIDVLNDVTAKLIDSQKGYMKCYEMTDTSYMFRSQFLHRANDREKMISQFQSQVRALGGKPETSGTVGGSMHRGFTDFASLFQKDGKAALNAIDDGEEHLAEMIEDKLKKVDLLPATRNLLVTAHESAKSGERFADRMEDVITK